MFFVSQKTHIKQSPNGIKMDGDFFGMYVIFRKKNQRETMPKGPTTPLPWAPLGGLWPPRKAVDALLSLQKKANIRIEIVLKFQPNRSYEYPGI